MGRDLGVGRGGKDPFNGGRGRLRAKRHDDSGRNPSPRRRLNHRRGPRSRAGMGSGGSTSRRMFQGKRLAAVRKVIRIPRTFVRRARNITIVSIRRYRFPLQLEHSRAGLWRIRHPRASRLVQSRNRNRVVRNYQGMNRRVYVARNPGVNRRLLRLRYNPVVRCLCQRTVEYPWNRLSLNQVTGGHAPSSRDHHRPI